ncbi:MAG: rhamnogalacturonan lyase [Lachnospiraceae bacterium]|nr:rhamnogalacturonan lyase [Lachnospiraceae bacterium]
MDFICRTASAEEYVDLTWGAVDKADHYQVYWADAYHEEMQFEKLETVTGCGCRIRKTTHVPHWFWIAAMAGEEELARTAVVKTEIRKTFHPFFEKLNRGLVAAKTGDGIFLSWRLMKEEVTGYGESGMTGTDFVVYRNGKRLQVVTDSTNYLDREGTMDDVYAVSKLVRGEETVPCAGVKAWKSGENYIDLPLKRPEGGVTPAGEAFVYHANDMSVGDVDGDGEYEYILKWDPSNAHDVSHRGYTGNCIIDCYKLDGRLLWRLDMGCNIRAGAHYTQFIVMDFNLDGKAEMAVKTAPGTRMTVYHPDGTVKKEFYVTMPKKDLEAGYSHQDNYVCSAADYREDTIARFCSWQEHPEVKAGHWPKTLEECFGIEPAYSYPLSREDGEKLADYFINTWALERSPKNRLDQFEGFIYKGPEYLTMFAGDGSELETISWKFDRVDDGLMWGDYAMRRIEPCNRVDRFLAGAAYLDGERPYLIMSRGYYTRSTIAVYSFFNNRFEETFSVDTGFVPMTNPFNDNPHCVEGTDPVFGSFAGQGNHSLSTADVDGDGRQEIVYGAAVIDHDGSLLYSSYDRLPDGTVAKLGHGDSMHVAKIDPDRPGLQIFNVFEGAKAAPYGYALRDAATGKVFFGEYAETDLGRCMIGKTVPQVRGWQVWADNITYDCKGNVLDVKPLGTNQGIRWAADLTTQVTDGVDYANTPSNRGIINDNVHGVMLDPGPTLTNNHTKGNPCLVADVLGDFRENILLRLEDDSAVRIFLNTEVTHHKLFTMMHDLQYRTSVAWQNNCYNQTGYPSFYYGPDMDWSEVIPGLKQSR